MKFREILHLLSYGFEPLQSGSFFVRHLLYDSCPGGSLCHCVVLVDFDVGRVYTSATRS